MTVPAFIAVIAVLVAIGILWLALSYADHELKDWQDGSND